MTTPKKGLRFYHARFIDTEKFDGKSPQLMVVTRVARGTVYYRPVYNHGNRETFGSPWFCATEKFSSHVKSAS